MADLWRLPDDKIWALKKAAEPIGFIPHAKSTVEFLMSLEFDGLLIQSATAPVWHITDKGRAELAALSSTEGKGAT